MTGMYVWLLSVLGTATPSPLPTPLPTPPDEPVDPGRGGWLAVGLIIFLVVAVVVLYRSMRKQMSRVSDTLPRSSQESPTDPSTR